MDVVSFDVGHWYMGTRKQGLQFSGLMMDSTRDQYYYRRAVWSSLMTLWKLCTTDFFIQKASRLWYHRLYVSVNQSVGPLRVSQ